MRPEDGWQVRRATVHIYPDPDRLGAAAAEHGAEVLRAALAREGWARMVAACAPSQAATIGHLARAPGLDWSRIEVFHMDEYVGLAEDHPAGFRRWLREHLLSVVKPGRVHLLAGDAPDPEAECARYAALLADGPIDLCLLGFGENGHIAFNDPPVADFADPQVVKIVTLDERCRVQQVAEGHFPSLEAVPAQALTLTCPTLLNAGHLVCSVPGERKAEAVRAALEGPRSTACPGSAVGDHPRAAVYLDRAAAAQLRRAAPV